MTVRGLVVGVTSVIRPAVLKSSNRNFIAGQSLVMNRCPSGLDIRQPQPRETSSSDLPIGMTHIEAGFRRASLGWRQTQRAIAEVINGVMYFAVGWPRRGAAQGFASLNTRARLPRPVELVTARPDRIHHAPTSSAASVPTRWPHGAASDMKCLIAEAAKGGSLEATASMPEADQEEARIGDTQGLLPSASSPPPRRFMSDPRCLATLG